MGIRIFLGNAPWKRPGYYGVRAGSRWPHFEADTNRYMPFPFQLAYAAALLEQDSHGVLLVDAIAEKMPEELFLTKVVDHRPDMVILETSTPSFDTDISMIRQIRERLQPGTRLVLSGPHAPMWSPDFLDNHSEVDITMVGEYELTSAALARAIETEADLESVPGIVYRDHSGTSRLTGKTVIVEDLNLLPWPARHFLPMDRYFDNPGNIPEPALQMRTNRGCIFSCSYCIWPQLMDGNRFRTRSVSNILDEIEHVTPLYGARSVYFDDDTFNIGKERMLRFCREKIDRKLDIPWAIMARADLMDEEILEAMAAANLWAVKYGIESADPELLENVNKKLDLDRASHNVLLTKKLGIKTHLTFMFGIPGETRDTIRKTVSLAKKLNPDSVQFSILTPLPGTSIYDELIARGHIREEDWRKYDGYNSAVIRTDALDTGDLEAELARAWRHWFRHRAINNISREDLARLLRQFPQYLRYPRAALKQLRSLFHV